MKNIILWIILASVWGSSYLAIKIAVESISPLTLVAMRMSIGTVILLVVLRAQSLSLPRDLASWKVLTVSGLFGSIIPFSLISFGELHVESGLAALLMGIAPVVTILLAPLAHKDEKLTKNSLIGIGFGVVGLLVLFGPAVLNGIGSHIIGQSAVLGAALCYAFTTLYVRKYANLPAVTMSAGSMLIGTIIIVAAALILDP
ncbi:MAG: DMT family transporter, partial [Alphaproteobacteria bacterium]|nr:DMT family transporter [Alphaproteobacteria bacterium]